MPMDPGWKFPRDHLTIDNTLSEGVFRKKIQAKAMNMKQPGESLVMAVKMLKEGHTVSEMIDLLSEMSEINIYIE